MLIVDEAGQMALSNVLASGARFVRRVDSETVLRSMQCGASAYAWIRRDRLPLRCCRDTDDTDTQRRRGRVQTQADKSVAWLESSREPTRNVPLSGPFEGTSGPSSRAVIEKNRSRSYCENRGCPHSRSYSSGERICSRSLCGRNTSSLLSSCCDIVDGPQSHHNR